MKYIQFILILISFLSCKKEIIIDNTLVNNSIRSEELISFEEELIDTIIFNKSTIIPLETNDENLFKRIDRITINNGRIYLLDNSLEKVCIFDDKGKSINQIHKIGQGPGEYISIMDFCLDKKNNEILLLCDVPYKLMRFSINGQFINDIAYSNLYEEISIDSDNNLFCKQNEVKEKYEIGCFNKKMESINKRLATRMKINKECYYAGKALVKSKNLIYTRRFDPSIYYLFKDSIEKKYEFDFGKYKTPKDLQYEEDSNIFFLKTKNNEHIYSITNAVESNKYIFFNTNLGICIYEKETNKLKGYKMLSNQLLELGSSIYFPNDGDGNTLITSIDPASLAYYDEEYMKKNPIINDLVSKVKSDDNPILIVYEFK